MFYFLSKTLDFFLLPLSWVFILLFGALLTKKKSKRTFYLILSILWLYAIANPFLANWLMLQWETPPKAWEELPRTKSLGVILSGITNPLKTPRDRVYLNKGADRVLHTIELYKRGIIQQILVSGNYTRLNGEEYGEAEQIRYLLRLAEIPDSVIFLEQASKNTYENAVNVAKWIAANTKDDSVILVTSAFHIKRAVNCFKKQGIEVTPFPVDFYTRDLEFHPLMLLPSQASLSVNSVLFREVAGFYIYKIVGYL